MITVHYHSLNPQDVHLKELQLRCTTRSRAAKDVNRNIRKHSRSLIIISLDTFWIAKDARFLHADNKDSDQTVRMHSLI